MSAAQRHRIGRELGDAIEQRHGGDQIVGAQAHLHRATRIGTRGDRPAKGEDMNARLGHQVSLSDLKKRSASAPPTFGPMKASDTKRRSFDTASWRSWLPPARGPADSTAAAPATSRQSVFVHLPP